MVPTPGQHVLLCHHGMEGSAVVAPWQARGIAERQAYLIILVRPSANDKAAIRVNP